MSTGATCGFLPLTYDLTVATLTFADEEASGQFTNCCIAPAHPVEVRVLASAAHMAPVVSIIIPCFIATERQAALLEETLATVEHQSFRDYEVVIVDDGSPLEVRPTGRRVPQMQIVRQSNGGSAVARNTGIRHSRGEFVVFLDADDHLLTPALETGVDALRAVPHAGFAIGPREEMTFEGNPVAWPVPPPPSESDVYPSLLAFDWYIIPPSSAMFRRAVVEDVGGFQDPWGADDLDFYLRVAQRHPACCYQTPAVTRYRRYSTSSSRDGERMLHSVRAVYGRQWPAVRGNAELEAAHRQGLAALTEIFLDCVVENIQDRLRAGSHDAALRAARLLREESPERWRSLLDAGLAGIAAVAEALERGRSAESTVATEA
jgi:GT2 family glycosyltransferase